MMTSENLKIIPNFLNYYGITDLVNQITDRSFPWHYAMSEGEPEQYSHLLYYDHQFSKFIKNQLFGAWTGYDKKNQIKYWFAQKF